MDRLLTEAAYRTAASTGTPIPDEDVPAYRVSIARLARRLTNFPGGNVPAVQQWIASAAGDPFLEVREAVIPGGRNKEETAY